MTAETAGGEETGTIQDRAATGKSTLKPSAREWGRRSEIGVDRDTRGRETGSGNESEVGGIETDLEKEDETGRLDERETDLGKKAGEETTTTDHFGTENYPVLPSADPPRALAPHHEFSTQSAATKQLLRPPNSQPKAGTRRTTRTERSRWIRRNQTSSKLAS